MAKKMESSAFRDLTLSTVTFGQSPQALRAVHNSNGSDLRSSPWRCLAHRCGARYVVHLSPNEAIFDSFA